MSETDAIKMVIEAAVLTFALIFVANFACDKSIERAERKRHDFLESFQENILEKDIGMFNMQRYCRVKTVDGVYNIQTNKIIEREEKTIVGDTIFYNNNLVKVEEYIKGTGKLLNRETGEIFYLDEIICDTQGNFVSGEGQSNIKNVGKFWLERKNNNEIDISV